MWLQCDCNALWHNFCHNWVTKFIVVVIMWEIMWSWWWVKPLPSEKHFIRKDNNIKENNLIKNWLRASLKKRRQSRCKSVNNTNNQNHKRSKEQVKFLYESKSGKSFRQSGNYGEYVNPYFQKNTIGYVINMNGIFHPG